MNAISRQKNNKKSLEACKKKKRATQSRIRETAKIFCHKWIHNKKYSKHNSGFSKSFKRLERFVCSYFKRSAEVVKAGICGAEK